MKNTAWTWTALVAALAMAITATVLLQAGPASAHQGGTVPAETRLSEAVQMQIARARRATAPFHDLQVAFAAGYGPWPVVDLKGRSCIDEPGQGAMGVHYVNGSLLASSPEAEAPQALIYEPMADGSQRLVGVEYIVFQSVWEARHPGTTPELYGEPFHLSGADNRYGLPPFYALHLWLWQPNREGMFEDWNPAVRCP